MYTHFQIGSLRGMIILYAFYADSCATFITLKHIFINWYHCRDARLNFPDSVDAADGEEGTLGETASVTQETGKPLV
jgi:hypothetical protein